MAMMGHGMATDWGDKNRPISKATLRRMVRLFLPQWRLLGALFGTVLIGSIVGLIPPLLSKWIVDDAILQGNLSLLFWLAGAMVAAAIGLGLLTVIQGYFNIRMVQRVMYDMRNALYSHLLDLPLRFYTRTKAGEIIARATNDVNGIQAVLTANFSNMTMNIFTVITTVVLMLFLDPILTLMTLAALPLFILPTRAVSDARVRIGRTVQEALADITATLSEKLNIGGLILVKSFAQKEFEVEQFERKNRVAMERMISEGMVTRWLFMFTALFAAVVPAIIYAYGGWQVIQGTMSLGAIVAFIALAARLFMPVTQLLNVQVDIAGSVALFERIFEYLDLPTEIADKPNAITPARVEGRVAFNDVSFAYEPGKPTLNHISFSAEPGEMVAIVGPSGAGKTSISYLLMRLYDPNEGSVTIDGIDLRDLSLKAIGKHVGVVTQETNLFHTTIADNIRYAKPDATLDELIAAARAANIHQVIEAMPRGYDTVVGERGYRLSGGEKQRVAIARLILKNPQILILDEATASLDTQSERLIQEALEELMRGRTSFVIAHRLSTILAADKILVMDKGELVEVGRHAELLMNGGLYKSLYEIQFRDESQLPEPVPAG